MCITDYPRKYDMVITLTNIVVHDVMTSGKFLRDVSLEMLLRITPIRNIMFMTAMTPRKFLRDASPRCYYALPL